MEHCCCTCVSLVWALCNVLPCLAYLHLCVFQHLHPLCSPFPRQPTMVASRITAGVPRLTRFCVERKRPSKVEHYSNGYTRKCKEYCREQFQKFRCFGAIVDIVKETELRAKTIRRKKGRDATLLRNKRASMAELRGMTAAFLEVSGEHAAALNDGICLPIRQPSAAPCRNCTQYKRKVADLQHRVKEFESNVIEIAARKLVDEARRSVHDEEWASVKRKLSLAFHPDKLRCCPNAGASFFKAFANHPRW